MCTYAVKLGNTREHQCLLLQVIFTSTQYLLGWDFFLLFLKFISCRDNPLPPRKAISKSSQILRILLSTGEACLICSGSCQTGERCVLKLSTNLLFLLLHLLFQEICLDLTTMEWEECRVLIHCDFRVLCLYVVSL